MLFNSIQFLIFLPLVVVVYFSVRSQSYRKYFLLASSLYFYSVWSLPYTGLLLLCIFTTFFSCRLIDILRQQNLRKLILIISISINVSLLLFFKYYNFVDSSLSEIFDLNILPSIKIFLPMGISFYTFQSISCVVDAYQNKLNSRNYSLLDFALYIAFFPQLVAGPIMRASELLPQFSKVVNFVPNRLMEGLFRVCIGLLKKAYLADPLSRVVNDAYGSYLDYSSFSLLIATYAFALQIYFDFSGYCDVAIGVGKMLGFDLDDNFDSPYLSTSIREFWRRWHITLSNWLRDYIYIPLGGSRCSFLRTNSNLLITMLLGGLWHGAAWTFVAWGGLQGIFLIAERVLGIKGDKINNPIKYFSRLLITFHLVCLSWIFFRAEDFAQAFGIIQRILSFDSGISLSFFPLIILISLIIYQLLDKKYELTQNYLKFPSIIVRFTIYVSLILCMIAFSGAQNPDFIYFQF